MIFSQSENNICENITFILLGQYWYFTVENVIKYRIFFTGIKVKEHGPLLKDLFQTDYFRIVVCDDETTVEVCGALKVENKLYSSIKKKHLNI